MLDCIEKVYKLLINLSGRKINGLINEKDEYFSVYII